MLVRPLYLNIYPDLFFGRPYAENGYNSYAASQSSGGGQAIVASNVAAQQVVIPCNAGSIASALLTPGQPIIIGTQGSYNWQQAIVSSIASDNLTINPRLRTPITAGMIIRGTWYNSTHPGTTAPNDIGSQALATWLANVKRAGKYGGPNLLNRFTSRYVDVNGEAHVPMGWVTGRSLTSDGSGTWTAPVSGTEIAFSALTYGSGVQGTNTSDGNGFSITTGTTAYQGLKYLAPINVTPGQRYCLAWNARVTTNTAKFVIVDSDDPATIVATSGNIGLGLDSQFGVMGITEQLLFTVPAGSYRMELRFIENFAGGVSYVDWIRLMQVDEDETGQFALGSHNPKLAVLGDSWGVQVADYLEEALDGRGITITNNSQSGYRMDQLIAEFSSRVPSDSDACVLLASTNDIHQGASVPQVLERVADFCDLCEASQIQPIVMGAVPLGGAAYDLAVSNDLNNAMRDYVWNRAAFSIEDASTNDLTHVINLLEADQILEDVAGVQKLKTYQRGTTTELIPAKTAKQPDGTDLTNPATQRLAGYEEE